MNINKQLLAMAMGLSMTKQYAPAPLKQKISFTAQRKLEKRQRKMKKKGRY